MRRPLKIKREDFFVSSKAFIQRHCLCTQPTQDIIDGPRRIACTGDIKQKVSGQMRQLLVLIAGVPVSFTITDPFRSSLKPENRSV